MARAISNENFCRKVMKTADFKGAWYDLIGCSELHGSWLIWGNSGNGKTSFVLQLCKYLSQFGKVAYNSLEEGSSVSLQNAWNRENMIEVGRDVMLLNKESIADLCVRLKKQKAPKIVVIDSVMCMDGFNRVSYENLLRDFPKVLFIFIAHERRSLPHPAIAETIRRLSSVKINVVGYKAFATSRYGGNGKGYVIWKEGAEKYYAERIMEK